MTHHATSSMTPDSNALADFGFSQRHGGAHLARTMMLPGLRSLLAYVENPDAPASAYREAIVSANCLGKRSAQTRALSYRHLADLYALDPTVGLFRSLRFFWDRDLAGQPLLALLCAQARDSLLRASAPFILRHEAGARVTREALEAFLDNLQPDRFSAVTLTTLAQHINGSWTQAGHLAGKVHKTRTRAVATPGAVSLALLLGYIAGLRGELLFSSEFCQLLDCPVASAMDLAEEASRRGWITLKRIGPVVEVTFPKRLTAP